MSGSGDAEMTETEIIAMYEDIFKDRYTDSDTDYVECVKTPLPPPPCVQNWTTKRRPGQFNERGGRGRHGGQRGRGNWSRGGGGGGGPPRHHGYQDHRQDRWRGGDSYGPPPQPLFGGHRDRGWGDWQGPPRGNWGGGPPQGPRWGRGGGHFGGSRFQPY